MTSQAFIKFGNIKYVIQSDKGETLTVTKQINKPSIFEAELNIDSLIPFNYNDAVEVIGLRDGKEMPLFRGIILSSENINGKLVLKGADPLELLKELHIGAHFEKFTVPDIVYHLVKSVGLTPAVHGTFFDGKLLRVRIIIPIYNLKLCNTNFSFNEVSMCPSLPEDVNNFVEGSNFKQEFLGKDTTYAIVQITAADFIDAYNLAIVKVNRLLDWLSCVKNFSLNQINENILCWDYKLSKSLPKLTTYFYGDIQNREYKLIMDAQAKKASETLNMGSENKNFTELLQEKFEIIYQENIVNLISAIHWLRRAREYGDLKDKLLDYFTCIEFVINKQKTNKLFSKEKRKEIRDLVKPILNQDSFNRFQDYLSNINSPSFKSRLDSFLEENKVDLTHLELQNLENMRKKRCLIEHGSVDVQIYENELRLLGNAVEKLIISKLSKI